VTRSISTRASCAIAGSFAVGAHTQEKRVLFHTRFKGARVEAIFAFVPSFFIDPTIAQAILQVAGGIFTFIFVQQHL
jgi:hypothetical protein